MIKKLALVSLVLLLVPIALAEGPLYCDVQGYIMNADGTYASNDIPVKVTVIDEFGKAGGEKITHTVLTKGGPPPEFNSGFFFTSFTQGEDCNYGETVIIEVESDGITGKTESVLTELLEHGQYDVTLPFETGQYDVVLGKEISSVPEEIKESKITCEVSGFVIYENGNQAENEIPVTVTLQDTKGEATGRTILINTETKDGPLGKSGFYYVLFGQDTDCNPSEPLKIVAAKGLSRGETNSFVTYLPEPGQYDVVLQSLPADVEKTVQQSPLIILITTIGLILLILAIVFMKRRKRRGRW